jgi:hypothetical protein
MKKEFVPYELAVKLKELGFNEPCFFAFDNCSTPMRCSDLRTNEQKFDGVNYNSSTYTSQPTFSQAFRWFREKHKINGETTYLPNIGMYGIIASDMTVKPKDLSKGENFKRGSEVTDNYARYPTREEAESACLQKLIEIIKTK